MDRDYWVHDLDPFLIRFTEDFGIRYYGLAYVLSFLIAFGLLALYYKKGRSPLNPDQQSNALFAIIIGVLAGGRIGYVLFYDLGTFVQDPLFLFKVWEGGMASHGGFLGGIVGLLWVARSQRMGFLRVADIFATLAPPGLMLGRIANFINGELWGRVTDVSWAVIFPASQPGAPVEEIPPRHPSQLYEAALEGGLLVVYLQLRFWKSDVTRVHPGQLSGEFLLLYSAARIFCEFFREPDADLILGMTRGIFFSLFLAMTGLAVIVYARKRPADG